MILIKRNEHSVEAIPVSNISVSPSGATIRAVNTTELSFREFWLDVMDAAIDEISENKA